MADNPTSAEADLQAFVAMAGRSLADAQEAPGTGPKSELVLANAELEAKVALRADSSGKLSVQPVSAADLRLAQFNAAAVSTLRVSFVATAPAGAAPPKRTPGDISDQIRGRPDVKALETILGPLTINPVFVPETSRWMVTASDPKGRLVREVIVPDSTP
ncbi:MAG: hypothetical protein JNL34_07175 [Anaerolineae bacterium]|nr:hypothetical protein [Anaerolineae bacterium]